MYKFNKLTRYVTRGISQIVPIEIQLKLWAMVDKKLAENATLDYLQIFKFQKDEEKLVITHIQEQPKQKQILVYKYQKNYVAGKEAMPDKICRFVDSPYTKEEANP